MSDHAFMQLLPFIIMGGLIVGFAGICGWIFTTWLRVENGYPLETSWGTPLHPQRTTETDQRVTLLTQENAQLRAEIGSVKDRLATIERIVTDGAYRLDREIETLRGPAN